LERSAAKEGEPDHAASPLLQEQYEFSG